MRIARFILTLLVAVFLCTVVSSAAHADPVKCRAAIGKNAAAFAQTKMKLLQKCANNLAKKGLSTAPCPDAKTQEKIDKAESKAQAAVVKACGGKDKVCTGSGDDDALALIGWDTTCPNFENGDCDDAIANCSDIGDCITCVGEHVVDQAIGLYYGSLNPTNPKDSKEAKALNKCQLAIGKSTAGFFAAKTKALQKCWDTQNKNAAKGDPTVACPPFGAGDGKAQTSIDKAKAKADKAICKACGGADKACDGVNDILPADIAFPAECPPVTVPGTVPVPCTATVTTIDQLRACVDCVTEFKADCLSLAAATGFPDVPTYPTECNVVLPPTPTRTATPVPTVTSTPAPAITATATGGPAATVTPTVTGAAPTATSTGGGPVPTATQTPGGGGATCPTQLTFTGTSTNGILDTGWTGQGHDATVISDGTATVSVTSCAGTAPDCGVCNYTGPIANAAGQLQSRRCQNDSSIPCTSNGDCGGNACKFFFGSYLPLAAGGVSTCVENTFNGGISGTANVDTGTSAGTANLTSRVFSGPTLSQPCSQCNGDTTPNDGVKGGTCTGNGLKPAGTACDASGSSPNAAFGTTSLDCPPNPGGVIATLPIDLSNTTGSKTRTLSAASPTCRAVGFTTNKCQCETCNNAAATPCSTNADCTAVGATVCGGRRCSGGANNGAACAVNSECPGGACNVPGAATAPNQCDGGSGDCVDDPGTPSPNDRICSSGPFEQFCEPVETFRGCTSNIDCTFAGDACTLGKFRDCFDNGVVGDTVTATGNADLPVNHASDPTLAALFCIGPTSSSAVNSAAGLPGLGRLEITGHATDNGTP